MRYIRYFNIEIVLQGAVYFLSLYLDTFTRHGIFNVLNTAFQWLLMRLNLLNTMEIISTEKLQAQAQCS